MRSVQPGNIYMNEEEAKKRAEEWFKEREERTALNLRCIALAEKFRSGEFDTLDPIWHVKKEDIDFFKQKDQLDDELLVEGYSIIPAVNFDRLLSSFHSNQGSFISDRKITDKRGFVDNQLCRIVEHWKNKEALIPPIIIFTKGLNQNWPADGKHRMKIAYYLGAKELPVIVPNLQLQQVSALIL